MVAATAATAPVVTEGTTAALPVAVLVAAGEVAAAKDWEGTGSEEVVGRVLDWGKVVVATAVEVRVAAVRAPGAMD